MPSTTTGSGLPYPLPTEPVKDGANAIKALAEAVDTLLVLPSGWSIMILNATMNANTNGDALIPIAPLTSAAAVIMQATTVAGVGLNQLAGAPAGQLYLHAYRYTDGSAVVSTSLPVTLMLFGPQ